MRTFLVGVAMLGALFTIGVDQASAAAESTIISAVIAPVHVVVVSHSGIIQQVYSNSPELAAPSVYLGATSGPRVALSPAINHQYQAIMGHTGSSRLGLIYEATTMRPPVTFLTSLHEFDPSAR